MSEKRVNAYQIATALIGVTIGAGFASGQEVLQFFSFFGPASFAAIILSSFLFVFFTALILDSGARLRASSHREVVLHTTGKFLGAGVDVTITFFLFGSFTAMLAGTGASVNQQFGFPVIYGAGVMASVSLGTVLLGLSGIISALSFLTPVMVAGIITIFLAVLVTNPAAFAVIGMYAQPWEAVMPFWPLSAAVYVSYNMLMAVAILAPMGKLAKSKADIKRGALIGGIGLSIGILAINLSMLLIPESFGYQIPMGYIAGRLSPLAAAGYTIILLLGIYTTAVGGLYGFCARLADPATPRFRMLVPVVTVTAVLASIIGFTTLVRFLYAGVGIAGLILLGGLTYEFLRRRTYPRPDPAT